MVPLDYVLAVAALTAPASAGEEAPAAHACLRPAVRAVALGWEILDPREARTMLARPAEFAADLRLLRRRCGELADAPPLCDAGRFADRELVCELLAFNRAYHAQLERRQEAGGPARAGELTQALGETDALYRIYDLLRDARSDCYYVSVRRQALAALREAVGRRDYARGVLPPHVPLWRFERRD
jgi:hypothetical protein